MSEFDDRLKAAQEGYKEGRERAEQWGEFADFPIGQYIGRVQEFRYERAKAVSKRPQVRREIYCTEGTQKGNVCYEFIGLEHPTALSIMTRFVEACGYDMKEPFDYLASEKAGDFVTNQDFIDTVDAIKAEAPEVKFEVRGRRDGQGVNIIIMEVLGMTGSVPEAGAEEAEEAEDDSLITRLHIFCAAQGVEEVTKDDDLEIIQEKITSEGYYFWTPEVSIADLKAAGLDGCKPEDGISSEDAKLLEEIGLSAHIIKPKKQARGGAKKKA